MSRINPSEFSGYTWLWIGAAIATVAAATRFDPLFFLSGAAVLTAIIKAIAAAEDL